MQPLVRLKLFQSAVAFYRFLGVSGLVVKDIIFTGSNAAYNYTRQSDLDVHLVVDFSHTDCPALASNFFNTKKALWSQTFNVTIHGHSVELYVEDETTPVKANGVYSILHHKWLKVPERTPPTYDDIAVEHKVESFATAIDGLLDGQPTVFDLNQMLKKLFILRQNGLLNGGEFSVENITFKVLRSLGYIQKMYDKRIEVRDKTLSLP